MAYAWLNFRRAERVRQAAALIAIHLAHASLMDIGRRPLALRMRLQAWSHSLKVGVGLGIWLSI